MKSYAVIIQKLNVKDPFAYESFIKYSTNMKILSIFMPDKIKE